MSLALRLGPFCDVYIGWSRYYQQETVGRRKQGTKESIGGKANIFFTGKVAASTQAKL